MIGVTQEQHPDRTRLFAQWQQFDWPILWDPFNLTGAKAVPLYRLVDEHGVVRETRVRPDALGAFLAHEHEPPASGGSIDYVPSESREQLVQLDGSGDEGERALWGALSAALWGGPDVLDGVVRTLGEHLAAHPDDAPTHFRHGVALRMRHDSDARQPGDFQAALDAWSRALEIDPNQYIWRRRIQQYGPRLDKPYPFYNWIEQAQAEVRERGEEPVDVRVALTGAERVSRGNFRSSQDEVEPDPGARIRGDGVELIELESAVAFDTTREHPIARVHLEFRPAADGDAHWNNEAEPMLVWLGSDALPAGVELERRLFELEAPAEPVSDEVRVVDFEVRLPEGRSESLLLEGYALFNACRGESGQCLYLRADFSVVLTPQG